MVLGLVLGLQGFGQDIGLECLEPESTPAYVFATVVMAFKQRKHLLYLHLKMLLSFCHLKCSPSLTPCPSLTYHGLARWFSAFLMLRLFNTAPHVVVIPPNKIIFIATS